MKATGEWLQAIDSEVKGLGRNPPGVLVQLLSSVDWGLTGVPHQQTIEASPRPRGRLGYLRTTLEAQTALPALWLDGPTNDLATQGAARGRLGDLPISG